jgi:hypothetical protein
MARRLFTLLSPKTGCSCFVSRAMAAPRTSCRMTLVTCCIHESHPTAGGSLAPASYTAFKSGTGPPANADLKLVSKNSSYSTFKLVPRPRPFSSYVQASFRLKLLLGDCVRLLLVVLLLGGPIMACAIPDAQLTAAEKQCCKNMGGGGKER